MGQNLDTNFLNEAKDEIYEVVEVTPIEELKTSKKITSHPITQRIKKHLASIHFKWCASIKDPDVRIAATKGTTICGGAIASLFIGEDPKDYDIYCLNNETQKILFEYYLEQSQAYYDKNLKNIVILTEPMAWEKNNNRGYTITVAKEDPLNTFGDSTGFRNIFLNSKDVPYAPNLITYNAISLNDKIQLVSRYRGPIDKLCETFDFHHCMCGYHPHKDEIYIPEEALLSIASKRLCYRGNSYPIYSLLRVLKFTERGWKISAGEMLKISFDISRSKISEKNQLQNQLRGFYGGKYNYIIDLLSNDNKYKSSIDFKDLCDLIDMECGEELADLKKTFRD